MWDKYTVEIHVLDLWVLNWTTIVAGEEADTCQLYVSFTYYSSGTIYVTLVESTLFYAVNILSSFKRGQAGFQL